MSIVYDRLKEELGKSDVIHADETPVVVTKDGREGTHKSYMWVYRSGSMCEARQAGRQAVIYDYQKTRKADAPYEFLKGFEGTLVCDGYQVYHTLENRGDTKLTVAGCWTHARRPFAQVYKTLGEKGLQGQWRQKGIFRYRIYIRQTRNCLIESATIREGKL